MDLPELLLSAQCVQKIPLLSGITSQHCVASNKAAWPMCQVLSCGRQRKSHSVCAQFNTHSQTADPGALCLF
jgi:hypothetical protein